MLPIRLWMDWIIFNGSKPFSVDPLRIQLLIPEGHIVQWTGMAMDCLMFFKGSSTKQGHISVNQVIMEPGP